MSHSLSIQLHPPCGLQDGTTERRHSLEKRNLAECLWTSLCSLCKPQFSQLVPDRVKQGGKQEGALLAGNKQSCGKEVWY